MHLTDSELEERVYTDRSFVVEIEKEFSMNQGAAADSL